MTDITDRLADAEQRQLARADQPAAGASSEPEGVDAAASEASPKPSGGG